MKQVNVFRDIHIQLLRKATVKLPSDRHGDSVWRRSLLGGADRWSTFRSKHEGRVNLVVQATTGTILVSLQDRDGGGGKEKTEKKGFRGVVNEICAAWDFAQRSDPCRWNR